ncbi:MAG: hypothetical protein AAGF47_08680 [Planctomycetota bacterium]
MILNPHPYNGVPQYLPFEIKTGDVIAVLQEPWPEHRAIMKAKRTWQDVTTPVRSIEGTHAVDTTTLRGAESLRTEAWIVLIVASGFGFLTASALAMLATRQLMRFRRNLCPKCRYPLIETGRGRRCTECGVFVPLESAGITA